MNELVKSFSSGGVTVTCFITFRTVQMSVGLAFLHFSVRGCFQRFSGMGRASAPARRGGRGPLCGAGRSRDSRVAVRAGLDRTPTSRIVCEI